MVVGVILFSLFLDIDGQSLRLRGPAINWWLFFLFVTKVFELFLKIIVSYNISTF